MNISLTRLCLGVFCDCGRITANPDITRKRVTEGWATIRTVMVLLWYDAILQLN
jgi:hypothetical protein